MSIPLCLSCGMQVDSTSKDLSRRSRCGNLWMEAGYESCDSFFRFPNICSLSNAE